MIFLMEEVPTFCLAEELGIKDEERRSSSSISFKLPGLTRFPKFHIFPSRKKKQNPSRMKYFLILLTCLIVLLVTVGQAESREYGNGKVLNI